MLVNVVIDVSQPLFSTCAISIESNLNGNDSEEQKQAEHFGENLNTQAVVLEFEEE